MSFDIFKGTAGGFDLISLNGTVDKVDYRPNYLSQFFTKKPTTSRTFWVDRRSQSLDLVPTSPIGSAPVERVVDPRDMVNLTAVRLAKGRTLTAAEVFNLRAFGSEDQTASLMAMYDQYRQAVRADIEATLELHRLGALQGRLIDTDGRQLFNYFTEFNAAEAATLGWNLTSATFDVRDAASKLKRVLLRKAKGLFGQSAEVVILCGDDWFDALLANAKLQATYLNISAQESANLRTNGAFEEFTGIPGIRFVNYRGTDDNQEIAIKTGEAFAFVAGTDSLVHAVTPTPEFMIPGMGGMGREFYAMNLRDQSGRDAWVRYEEYAYPLMYNKRPEATQRLRLGA